MALQVKELKKALRDAEMKALYYESVQDKKGCTLSMFSCSPGFKPCVSPHQLQLIVKAHRQLRHNSLLHESLIIMEDEPTGNLDAQNSEIVLEIFKEICAMQNQTIIVVTHDEDFAACTDEIIEMKDREIVGHSAHT